jgi:hypothetical protein
LDCVCRAAAVTLARNSSNREIGVVYDCVVSRFWLFD